MQDRFQAVETDIGRGHCYASKLIIPGSVMRERMMTLSRIYGFWKYITGVERAETQRYLEMFYSLQLRPRIETVEAKR